MKSKVDKYSKIVYPNYIISKNPCEFEKEQYRRFLERFMAKGEYEKQSRRE